MKRCPECRGPLITEAYLDGSQDVACMTCAWTPHRREPSEDERAEVEPRGKKLRAPSLYGMKL